MQIRGSKRLTVDNGKQFDCYSYKEYCKTLRTHIKFSSVYHPQSNGAVKRANGLIFSGIKKCLFDQKKGKWTDCRMDLPGPTASVGTRTDYSVGPWDYSACATRHLMAWGARTTVEKYSDRNLYMSCTM
jgi:transposase InsO family protein